MRWDNRIILGILVALTAILFPIAALTSGLPRIILSFLFMLFFPGYALISLMFPYKGDLRCVERIALSFGLSIAILPLIGFVLNFTPWGIRFYPILISLASLIVLACVAAIVRSWLLPPESRLIVTLHFDFSGWRAMSTLYKGFIVAGVLVVLCVAGAALYFAISLPPTQQPTEFYILNSEGKAENYPRQAKINEWLNLKGVVINHEAIAENYSVSAVNSGKIIGENTTGLLVPGEKWEGNVNFILNSSGANQRIDFYLYKDTDQEPYFKDPLYIYIDISTP